MPDLCHGCGREIVPLQDARYTGREPEECWHYGCWEKGRPEPTNMRTLAAEMATNIERVNRAMNRVRRVLRDKG